MQNMKAIVYTEYGSPDVLSLKEVAKPIPTDDQVLIKIHATSVNAADDHLLRADPFMVRIMSGLLKPKFTILGADVAGVVEAVGKNVTLFKVGDEVFGDLSASGWGGFAEYVCAKENVLVSKPANITFEQAAASGMSAVTALQGLRDKGQIKAGQKVLINGASGGVGTFAVQIAKVLGAEVTAVCSTSKVEMVKELGADSVIDYSKEDFAKNSKTYDLTVAVSGNRSISDYKSTLNPNGRYVVIGGSGKQLSEAMLLGPWVFMSGNQKASTLLAKPNKTDLAYIAELLQTNKITPVIDKTYALKDVADAMRYLEEGHAKGKIVIRMI
jgi:NADPH:quinone reductase-like Zn-dependent oxidoreductase